MTDYGRIDFSYRSKTFVVVVYTAPARSLQALNRALQAGRGKDVRISKHETYQEAAEALRAYVDSLKVRMA